MRFFITQPFFYRSRIGRQTYINPAYSETRVFDTADPRLDLDETFVPPVIGLRAMDNEAQAALYQARYAAGLVEGVQYIGIGVLPPNDVYVP